MWLAVASHRRGADNGRFAPAWCVNPAIAAGAPYGTMACFFLRRMAWILLILSLISHPHA